MKSKNNRNKFFAVLFIALSLTLGSCTKTNPYASDEKYQIYLKATTDGTFSGTYAEWLATIKGEDGKDGTNGKDGEVPYIGDNGNWWIGDHDTGIAATGPKGDSGAKGEAGQDGKDGIDGTDGADGKDGEKGDKGEDGKDGKDGKDGTDGKDGEPGQDGKDGEKGEPGEDGQNGVDGLTPHIGENGNWWIGATDTGIKADYSQTIYEKFLADHPQYVGDYDEFLDDLMKNNLFFNIKVLDGNGSGVYYKYEQVTVSANEMFYNSFVNWTIDSRFASTSIVLTFNAYEHVTLQAHYIVKEASSGFDYVLNEGKVTITGIGSCVDTDLIIPSTIDGYPVEIVTGFADNHLIKNVYIPETVKDIAPSAMPLQGAFYRCYNLETVYIAAPQINIGEYSFYECNKLHSINISQYSTVARYAFRKTALSEIIVPRSSNVIEEGAFLEIINTQTIFIPLEITLIRESAFHYTASVNGGEVFYEGSATDWAKITIGASNEITKLYFYSYFKPNVTGNYWHYNALGMMVKW